LFDEDERATLSAVIVRESGRSSIPETLMMESRGRGVLDTPHAALCHMNTCRAL
jgi:hypothetical protein